MFFPMWPTSSSKPAMGNLPPVKSLSHSESLSLGRVLFFSKVSSDQVRLINCHLYT